MAATVLARGDVRAVIVGADRVAANGDVANKIGTYGVAILARAFGVPFYVAVPLSTIDFSLASGAEIPIEERASDELTTFNERPVTPPGVRVFNPAFDVTPAEYVTAFITEHGVVEPPFGDGLAALLTLGAPHS
jgi:methylthioribose-1-phosphate isomerase